MSPAPEDLPAAAESDKADGIGKDETPIPIREVQ